MPRIGIGLGLGLFSGSIDAQAQAHYNRVIADGGVVPAGVSGTNAFFNAVKSIYGTSDITTAISVGVDAHYLGYKLGAGAGATSGQAVQKLYSCAGSSGDVVQTTAASQPLLLEHNGASSDNYYYGSGVSGNYVSTPSAAANQITGDIEIISKKTKIKDYTGTYAIVSKGDQASNRGWVLRCSAGTLAFLFSQTGTGMVSAVATVTLSAAGYAADTLFFFKVTRLSSSGTVKFFGSTDGITYNQIGADVTVATGAMFNSTGQVCIGSWNNDSNHFLGSIGGVTIANSIGGTPVVDFNPATYNASVSQTQWTSTTGEVYTINTGTATTGYKGVLVDRTIVQSDGIDDKVSTTGITLSNNHTNYCAYKALVQDGSGNRIIYNNGTTNFVNAIASLSTNTLFISLTNLIFGIGGTKVFQTLGLSTSVFGTNNTKSKINNGSFSTPLIGTYVGGAGISLFGAVTVHFANSSINTMIVSVSDDSATINTAMYNYIRSINNNAF
jgi:hypothetical protein